MYVTVREALCCFFNYYSYCYILVCCTQLKGKVMGLKENKRNNVCQFKFHMQGSSPCLIRSLPCYNHSAGINTQVPLYEELGLG